MKSTRYAANRFSLSGLFGAASFIVVVGCSGAKTDEATTTTAEALSVSDAGLVTIRGTVTDSQYPQAGVTVTLSGGAQASVVTDFSGTYHFDVKPGSYSLNVTGTPNFFPPPYTSCLAFEPSVVNLNNLATGTTVNFLGSGTDVVTNCAPTSHSGATSGTLSVSGVVTSGGQPVPGIAVLLNGSTQGFRVTDESGAYRFSVNPGSYSLNLTGPCGAFTPSVVNLNNLKTSQIQNFDGSSCPPAPLVYCPMMDATFALTEPASCRTTSAIACANDRLYTWAGNISFDFLTISSGDCRLGQWNNPPIASSFNTTTLNQWTAALNLFTLQLFGCALQGNLDGPLPFAMIPAALASLPFTAADLTVLVEDYMASIHQALLDNGSSPLSAAQTAAVREQLDSAANRVAHVSSASTLTYSTCPKPDAGH